MTEFSWLSFIAFIFSCGCTPGPNTMMAATNGARYGFWNAQRFNLGILAGLSVLCAVLVLAMDAASGIFREGRLAFTIVSAAYMTYLAIKLATAKISGEREDAQTSFISGVAHQFVNPKLYIYLIMTHENYIFPHFEGPSRYVASASLVVIAYFTNVLYSAVGSLLFRAPVWGRRAFNWVAAALLMYCVVRLFV